MQSSRLAHLLLWGIYALVGVVHLTAMLAEVEGLQRVTQSLLAPALIGVVLTAVPRLTRTSRLLLIGLLCAWCGDFFSQISPDQVRTISALFFLGSLIAYAAALAPLWRRNRDTMRIALAIPYGAVVIGLFVACADGAGTMLPLVAAYALALAVTAFLSAGGNGLTWSGGTLFLLSSSLLAMTWFLPGAAIAFSTVWVMLTYIIGQALLVAGLLLTVPTRRWDAEPTGAALVILES